MEEKKEFNSHIKKISHICMVVKDMDKSIKTYEEVYGIGPWIMGGKDDFKYIPGTTYVHGKQVDFNGRLAICSMYNVDLELIQPMDENSHYAEFLREHGEGMHHIFVEVDNKDEFVKTVKDRGNETLFEGYVAVPPFTEQIYCTYYDMRKDLGMIVEIAPDPPVPIR